MKKKKIGSKGLSVLKILTIEGFYCDVISGKKVVCLYKCENSRGSNFLSNLSNLIKIGTWHIWSNLLLYCQFLYSIVKNLFFSKLCENFVKLDKSWYQTQFEYAKFKNRVIFLIFSNLLFYCQFLYYIVKNPLFSK